MLGFLKPRGELVEVNGRTVVFLSAKPFKVDQRFEVKLWMPEPSKENFSVPVKVLSCRSGPEGFYVVVSTAEGRREPPARLGYSVRGFPRALHRITIKSEGLPGYRAVTKDLSRGGFCAELDGELPESKILNVRFEFDEPLGWTLDLQARVAWTSWRSQNRYDTGFAFIEAPQSALALEQLSQWLDHRATHELVPFKPPDKLPPKRPSEPPNQLPRRDRPLGDDDPTPLGLPVVSDDDPTPTGLPSLPTPPPTRRSISLNIPEPVALERPSTFSLQQSGKAKAPEVSGSPDDTLLVKTINANEEESPENESLAPEDVGFHVRFQATLRGWAWEGADDALTLVLEDEHGDDHWLEFPACRGFQARCRQRETRLMGMAVTTDSTLLRELTREEDEDGTWIHYRLYDDHQRTVVDLVARECREQVRS